MSKRKKYAVRKHHGSMCNICGRNCGKGAPLKKHIEAIHEVDYDIYNKCFYDNEVKTIIADEWDDSVSTSKGNTVITHVLVRRFVGNPGSRGVAKTARVNSKIKSR